ncbi:MAG: hypothetical protein IPM66_03080 [Acidobacteriota bacterium]|nr:MAG: hypothetical protein IPM66_03080 [Acidobacteriota bacterium]
MKSWSYKLFGGLIAAIGFFGILVAGSREASETPTIVMLAWVTLFITGGWLIHRGLKSSGISAAEAMRRDPRPPVIYLRSFDQEMKQNTLKEIFKDAFQGKSLPGGYSAWGPREQYDFAKTMKKFGPYIAIGRPGEKLPELGAARAYVSDENWQSEITGWIDRASIVVIEAGRTPGLAWEIGRLIQCAPAEKVLLILPERKSEYALFRDWAREILPKPLPEEWPDSRMVAFSPDWQPRPLPRQAKLADTLKPFVLGAPAPSPAPPKHVQYRER